MTMNSLLLERARFLLLLPLLLSFHSALPLSSLDVFSDLLAPCLHSTPSWAHLCPSQHSALHGSLLPMVKGLIYLSLQCPRKQTSYSPQAELFAIAAAIEYANEDLRSSNQGCEYLYRLSTSIVISKIDKYLGAFDYAWSLTALDNHWHLIPQPLELAT